MDESILTLLRLLPNYPKRTDSTFEQVSDLVQIGEKLGMSKAVKFLNQKLDFARKWYGPKPLHPKQRSGVIHLLNSESDTVRFIGWKTNRAGDTAYDEDGNVVPGMVPVFVKAKKFAKSG